jgi:hypothetical protein
MTVRQSEAQSNKECFTFNSSCVLHDGSQCLLSNTLTLVNITTVADS